MKWALRIYSFILLIYTGWRTYDFISSTLPKDDISFWLAIAFLFSSECGLLLWHELNMQHVSTEAQEQIATWMTWIDFVASLTAGIADMILRQTFLGGYKVPPALGQFLIYGLPAIMALNVAAVLQYQHNDADMQMEREQRKVNFKIKKEALRDLRAATAEIAKDKKTLIYKHMRDQVTGQVDRAYMRASKQLSDNQGEIQEMPTLTSGAGESAPKRRRFQFFNQRGHGEQQVYFNKKVPRQVERKNGYRGS